MAADQASAAEWDHDYALALEAETAAENGLEKAAARLARAARTYAAADHKHDSAVAFRRQLEQKMGI